MTAGFQFQVCGKQMTAVNQFHATDRFLYPLKTSENLCFSDVSGGIERDQWHDIG